MEGFPKIVFPRHEAQITDVLTFAAGLLALTASPKRLDRSTIDATSQQLCESPAATNAL